LKRANTLDPRLEPNPEADARKFAAEGLIVEARNLASLGNTQGAIAAFRRATALNPNLHIDPEVEAERPTAESVLAKAARLMKEDRFKEAVAAYSAAITAYGRVQALDQDAKIRADAWNDLCWQGSLRKHAAEVMRACEKAVALAPNDWDIRDSRGLARALTGNISGAIDDFQFYINHTKDSSRKAQREGWVRALRKGQDPFKPDVIQQLFNQ